MSNPSGFITLNVSGQIYRTREITLRSSPNFANLLDRWSNSNDKQSDGSYLVDTDPVVFQHVLNFLRRPAKFPLFWSKEHGFNYTLYNMLEADADYFMLVPLRDWIVKSDTSRR